MPGDILSEGPPTISTDPDILFELLKDPRRRIVIRVLGDQEEIEVSDLVEQVIREQTGTGSEEDRKEFKKHYVALWQTHLPKIDMAGLIDFDEDENIVQVKEEGVLVSELLKAIEPSFEEAFLTQIVDSEEESTQGFKRFFAWFSK